MDDLHSCSVQHLKDLLFFFQHIHVFIIFTVILGHFRGEVMVNIEAKIVGENFFFCYAIQSISSFIQYDYRPLKICWLLGQYMVFPLNYELAKSGVIFNKLSRKPTMIYLLGVSEIFYIISPLNSLVLSA